MVKRKRGNNDAEADLSLEESPSSPVESSDDSGDNLGLIEVEMREDDDEEIRSAAAVPIILLDMAEQLYEAGDSKSLTKAITALEKAQTILLHLYPHEKITLEKARTKMATGKLKGKVPPGSSEVIASRLNTRIYFVLYTRYAEGSLLYRILTKVTRKPLRICVLHCFAIQNQSKPTGYYLDLYVLLRQMLRLWRKWSNF